QAPLPRRSQQRSRGIGGRPGGRHSLRDGRATPRWQRGRRGSLAPRGRAQCRGGEGPDHFFFGGFDGGEEDGLRGETAGSVGPPVCSAKSSPPPSPPPLCGDSYSSQVASPRSTSSPFWFSAHSSTSA